MVFLVSKVEIKDGREGDRGEYGPGCVGLKVSFPEKEIFDLTSDKNLFMLKTCTKYLHILTLFTPLDFTVYFWCMHVRADLWSCE